jgi:hypothetical protein
MKSSMTPVVFALIFILAAAFPVKASQSPLPTKDLGWPRTVQANDKELVIYQPQVDFWTDYKILHFRCAIAVKTGKNAKEKFGVAEVEADTVVDQANRVVALLPKFRQLRFPQSKDAEENALRRVVDELYPAGQAMTLSLDRVIAYLDPKKQRQQQSVELSLEPPAIFFSTTPAILVIFMGEPQFQPVVKDQNDLMFCVNTNWDVFFLPADQRYYLLNGDNWLMTKDPEKGPWTPAGDLPKSLASLPGDENWKNVRAQIPGKRIATAPKVYVGKKPAELILTAGEPTYSPIRGTRLMRMANTESPVFRHSGDKKFYFLTAGRWFRAASLNGPWTVASNNLPSDFAKIPDDDPAAFVKASVPGTVEAKDAVLLASIPTKTVTNLADAPEVTVVYDGQPKFQKIESTTVQYAVNSPNSIFLVNGSYYCCDNGVWFVSSTATGPWSLCSAVPTAIYTIPPSHPLHNVTYVVVQETTPTTVVYTQTAGYSGEYVATTGVLMFGAGMVVGALIADDYHDHHYYHNPYYASHYSYGWGARYDYHNGGYYGAGHASYGPYAGRGAGVAYNSNTGTYSRGAYAYGPAGSASAARAYNPYTGTRASAARVDTAYGSAGRAAAYNPSTGNAARAGYRSTERGDAAAVQTNRGTGAAGVRSSETGAGAVAWDTKYGQGAAARDRQGNVYAGKDGNVYKKDSSGSWSKNSGGGWESARATAPSRDLSAQASARTRSNSMSSGGGGGMSRGGGGGRRR